ncbi:MULTISPECIES: P-type conjugative transfer protein TrbL [Burkholderiaceae]|nr:MULTISPECIES: P-type conjugative transfer protein TrbL [Burkholderiaceae]KVE55249.1 conjugal transfer protein TrbL [Burkholderia vietnamiensis]KVE85802.1 conjugal transfer protein TrbL [Burkholderia vietnamiensis]MCW3657675.1 P-type conjugative transfer protein TrbL [Burkholderia cenocepacia]MDN7927482.1 P-type conjugative transfer protein TrbL [Burkholderia vietnamiensis]HDR8996000.1 P-type conjugative transfer protein TrbL [Burkholderia vietnamiensis]
MKKLSTTSLFLATVAFAGHAHAAVSVTNGSDDLLNTILQRYADVASSWSATMVSYASWLFWGLALLSMTWTYGMMALRKADIGEFLAETIRFFTVLGFFWWILSNGPAISISITDSMRQIAAKASGLSNGLAPSGIVDIGFDILKRVSDGSHWSEPVQSAIGILVAGINLVVLALVGVNMLLLLVTGWMLAYGGVFLLGFGGARWTSDIAIQFYKTVLGVGVQLFAMILLVGIGKSFVDQYYDSLKGAELSLNALFLLLLVSIVLLALVNKVPPMLASIVGGSSTGGIGVFGAGAAAAAAGSAIGAAGFAVGAASAAGSAAMGAASSAAGGASALKAAFQSAQQNMASGNGMFTGGGSGSSGTSGSSSGGSSSFASVFGNAGKFAADMGASLAQGAGAVAKDKAAGMMGAARDRIAQTAGGKISSVIQEGSTAKQQAGADAASFTGDSVGGAQSRPQSINEEVAAFVNRQPLQDT